MSRASESGSIRRFLLARGAQALPVAWPTMLRQLPAYVIGTLGAYWRLDRSLALLATG